MLPSRPLRVCLRSAVEVIGVSNDFKIDALKKFLAAHPEYAWPQLFDPQAAKEQEMHSVTTQLGIEAIPVMIILDKKGVVRSGGILCGFQSGGTFNVQEGHA